MISCITLKNNDFKQLKIKNVDEENIYKKCGYKTNNNFKKLYSWNINNDTLELWCKEEENIKKLNQHNIFTKYGIKVNSNNKSIFLLKNKEKFINLDSEVFSDFFNLKEEIEMTKKNNNNENNDVNLNNDNNNNNNNNLNNNNNVINIKSLTKEEFANDFNNNLDNEDEEYEYNSELSYELYSYSDEESEKE